MFQKVSKNCQETLLVHSSFWGKKKKPGEPIFDTFVCVHEAMNVNFL